MKLSQPRILGAVLVSQERYVLLAIAPGVHCLRRYLRTAIVTPTSSATPAQQTTRSNTNKR